MRRILIYVGFGLLALMLVLLGAILLLPKTPLGKSWIDAIARPRIENIVEKQLGSEITFDRLSGSLPGELIISDLTLAQDGEEWLTAERLIVRWHPFALLRRNIEIDELTGTQIILHRLPVLPARDDSTDDASPYKTNRSLLPLPFIRIGALSVDNFSVREPVFGQRYDVTFEGDLQMAGQRASANLALDTLTESDQLRLEASFDGSELALTSSALSSPSGLLTAALKAEDTVWMTIEGNGPLARWQGNVDAALGDYGSLSGRLGGDLTTFKDARFALDVAPGPLLPDAATTYLGEALHIEGETQREDTRIILTLNDMSARFGQLSGTLGIPVSRNTLFTADIAGELSEDIAVALNAPMAAGPASLQGQYDRNTDESNFNGVLTTDIGKLTLTEGRRDERTLFAGDVHLIANQIPFKNDRFSSLLERGGEFSSAIQVTDQMAISLRGLSVRLGQDEHSVTLSGSADYDRSENSLQATLAGAAGPEIATLLIGQSIFDDEIPFRVTANGRLDDARADFTVQYPDGQIEETPFSAGVLSANLTGLPSHPNGQIALLARDETYQGRLTITSTDDTYSLNELTFDFGELNLSGNAQYQSSTGAARANLTLDATAPTLLLTGEQFAGKVALTASYEGEAGQLISQTVLENIKYGRFDIQSAELNTNGSLSQLEARLSAQDADLPGVYLARADLGSTLSVTDGTRTIRLNRLRLAVDEDTEDQLITLLEPVVIEANDGIRFSKARLDWLKEGRVEIKGQFLPDQWIAEGTIESVALPGLVTPISGNFVLDTSANVPARFSASATAEEEDGEALYLLSSEGVWSGNELNLTGSLSEDGKHSLLAAQINWPVELTRENGRISIALPERPIEGTIEADGLIDPIYAFLPTLPPYVAGQLNGEIELSGLSNAPQFGGTLRLTEGRFEEPLIGVTLTELEGDIQLGYGPDQTSAQFDLVGAGANGRDQSVQLQGQIDLQAEVNQIDAKLTLNNATIIDGPTLTVRTGANLALTGNLDDLTLSGLIDVGQIDSAIPEPASSGQGEDIPDYPELHIVRIDAPAPEESLPTAISSTTPTVTLDVQVRAENEIFLRGRGLDTEWRANFDITGTSTAPLIDGDVILRRGSLDFAGRNFTFEEGRIEFQPGFDDLATVSARAVYEQNDTSAYVNVDGTVLNPSLSLSASPNMPEEDVMALILFGKQPTELSALESLQIANALRSLAGIGPTLGGDAGVRDALGLDALSIGIDEATGEGVVAVGKYISDDLYVSARQTARGTSSEVTVTYEVTDDITVESTLQPNGAQDVSVNYKKDY